MQTEIVMVTSSTEFTNALGFITEFTKVLGFYYAMQTSYVTHCQIITYIVLLKVNPIIR